MDSYVTFLFWFCDSALGVIYWIVNFDIFLFYLCTYCSGCHMFELYMLTLVIHSLLFLVICILFIYFAGLSLALASLHLSSHLDSLPVGVTACSVVIQIWFWCAKLLVFPISLCHLSACMCVIWFCVVCHTYTGDYQLARELLNEFNPFIHPVTW